ncbi:glycogenin glucosyltransferase [Massospora cicadina]|nr:glycogenin glucosyltransferase [Massospora cicadina]
MLEPFDVTSHPDARTEAYVTLVATDSYVRGAIVLGYSLRNTNTNKLLICLITQALPASSVTQLYRVFDHVLPVTELDTRDELRLALLGRPELGLTVTKIHIWSLTWIQTAIFLDADTLVLRNIDHLFDVYRGIGFAACPDPGWPDCFNSGVFICKPNLEVYTELMGRLATQGSFDGEFIRGGDQGLLNSYFDGWPRSAEQRLPFIYNVTPNAVYSYAPAFRRHSDRVAVMHFVGKDKPWDMHPAGSGTSKPHLPESSGEASGCSGNPGPKLTPKGLSERHPLKEHVGTDTSESTVPQDPEERKLGLNLGKAPHLEQTSCEPSKGYAFQGNEASNTDFSTDTAPKVNEPRTLKRSGNDNSRSQSEATLAAFNTRYDFETAYVNVPAPQSHSKDVGPTLPQPVLNTLAERNLLTPAHWRASEHHQPFPLFQEYLHPRSRSQSMAPTGSPQLNAAKSGFVNPPNSLNRRPLSPGSTLRTQVSDQAGGHCDDGSPAEMLDQASRMLRTQVSDQAGGHCADGSPAEMLDQASRSPTPQGLGVWKSIPVEYVSASPDDLSEGLPRAVISEMESVVSDSVKKIQLGVPWSASLTCTSSKPSPTPSGEFRTTYTLVWEEIVPTRSTAIEKEAVGPPLREGPRLDVTREPGLPNQTPTSRSPRLPPPRFWRLPCPLGSAGT